MSKPSKYNAVRTTVDGITFASKKEARRWSELKLMEKAGVISDVTRQYPFVLHADGSGPATDRVVGRYVSDFDYMDGARWVIEDVKGMKGGTPLYRWKKKHVEAEYDIRIKEV